MLWRWFERNASRVEMWFSLFGMFGLGGLMTFVWSQLSAVASLGWPAWVLLGMGSVVLLALAASALMFAWRAIYPVKGAAANEPPPTPLVITIVKHEAFHNDEVLDGWTQLCFGATISNDSDTTLNDVAARFEISDSYGWRFLTDDFFEGSIRPFDTVEHYPLDELWISADGRKLKIKGGEIVTPKIIEWDSLVQFDLRVFHGDLHIVKSGFFRVTRTVDELLFIQYLE